MKIKKAITQQFQVNPTSIIQFCQKFQRLHSIVANKNSQVITLMLKLVAKSSMFAPSTTLANMISCAQMEQFSHKNSSFVCGGINLTAIQPQDFSLTTPIFMRLLNKVPNKADKEINKV